MHIGIKDIYQRSSIAAEKFTFPPFRMRRTEELRSFLIWHLLDVASVTNLSK